MESERHRTDEKTYREFEKSFEGGKASAKSFADKHFNKQSLISDPDGPAGE